MRYGKLIEDSFRLGWRRKPLWILGLFASGGANYGSRWSDDDFFNGWGGAALTESDLGIALVIALVGLALVVGILGLILHVIAEGGLVAAARSLAREGTASFSEAWMAGVRHGLSIFVVFLAGTFLIVVEVALFVGIPILSGLLVHPILGILVGIVGAPVLALALLATIPVLAFAKRAVVLEKRGVGDALSRGVEILRRHPLQCAGVGLARFVVVVCVGAVSFAFIAATALPLVLVWAVSSAAAVAAGIVVVGPVLLALGGYTGCAGSYYWTYAFDALVALDEPRPLDGDVGLTEGP